MITIGAASPGALTGTDAGLSKPLRVDWDAAPFKFYAWNNPGALSARPV